jgi:hypothetical protein
MASIMDKIKLHDKGRTLDAGVFIYAMQLHSSEKD